ncbi:MFS transporter [Microlunatus endophyticus]|uniref:MFS transporter n=1 Tax=Microlunatus endophyticus TaxID=1716077 RepID=A0A917W4N9_9ACTN|nr:MFS transporter [Microlunatus endophyticus]GGL67975.1 MFS transporter [Microlunatus endophyticus]
MTDTAATADGGVSDRSPDFAAARPALAVLGLAVFAAVTTELLPVGLLPAISRQFHINASRAGLLVSVYAAMVMLTAVPLTLVTRRVPGKLILLLGIGSYAVSNLVCALAPNVAVLDLGRALGGVTHAIFFSVCIGYSARLVHPSQTGRALALVSAGVSAGLILGAPAATALGNAVGWRPAFGVLVILMIGVLILLARTLPASGTGSGADPVDHSARRRDVTAVLVANALAYVGQYAFYTYVGVLLLRAGATTAWVAPVLFLFGAFGLIGIWLASRSLDHRPRATALMILLVSGCGMIAVSVGFPSLPLVIIFGVIWNAAFGPAPSLFQTSAVRADATSPELSGAWLNVSANVGIAAGSAIGGVVLNVVGIGTLAWLSSIPLLIGAAVVLVGRRAFPSRTMIEKPDVAPVIVR